MVASQTPLSPAQATRRDAGRHRRGQVQSAPRPASIVGSASPQAAPHPRARRGRGVDGSSLERRTPVHRDRPPHGCQTAARSCIPPGRAAPSGTGEQSLRRGRRRRWPSPRKLECSSTRMRHHVDLDRQQLDAESASSSPQHQLDRPGPARIPPESPPAALDHSRAARHFPPARSARPRIGARVGDGRRVVRAADASRGTPVKAGPWAAFRSACWSVQVQIDSLTPVQAADLPLGRQSPTSKRTPFGCT